MSFTSQLADRHINLPVVASRIFMDILREGRVDSKVHAVSRGRKKEKEKESRLSAEWAKLLGCVHSEPANEVACDRRLCHAGHWHCGCVLQLVELLVGLDFLLDLKNAVLLVRNIKRIPGALRVSPSIRVELGIWSEERFLASCLGLRPFLLCAVSKIGGCLARSPKPPRTSRPLLVVHRSENKGRKSAACNRGS